MNCPTCGCCAKENMANFKKFYFCTECREEVTEQPKGRRYFPDDIGLRDLTPAEREEYERWLDSQNTTSDDYEYDFFFAPQGD